jgi:hypothetical protein
MMRRKKRPVRMKLTLRLKPPKKLLLSPLLAKITPL